MKETAVLFIDGSNFHHGMRKLGLSSGIGFDYEKFAQKLVQGRELVEVRYYTGQVKQEGDKTSYVKQRKFFNFLQGFEKVSYHTGRIETRSKKDTDLAKWVKALDKRTDLVVPQDILDELRVIASKNPVKYVEKAVDVMIAVDMVSMAYNGHYDVAYLLSADGDFTPAVKEVHEAGKKVIVASAKEGRQLEQVAHKFIHLKRDFFNGCWL